MEIIDRAVWGARYDDGSGDRALPAAEAWLHHSVTIAPDLVAPFDDEYRAMRTLEAIGEQRFGRGISYTFAVMPTGRVYEGHSVGRVGSHSYRRNTVAIGIVLVGDYDRRPPPPAMVQAVADLLRHAKERGWLRNARLNGGHRDFRATSCPGDAAYAAIPTINAFAARPTTPPPPTQEEDMPLTEEEISKIADRTKTWITEVLWDFWKNQHQPTLLDIQARLAEVEKRLPPPQP